MTDEQIIKALECCMKGNNCGGCCPYDDEDVICEECTSKLAKDALDLIKRQQVEIEDLIKQRDEQLRINRQVVRRNGKHVDERNRLKSKLEKEVDLNRELFEKMAKDEAEIERLKEIANPKCQQCVEQTRKNGIVEFANEIKHRMLYWSYDFQYNSEYIAANREIDDIVKEMTEGKDDE